jgi:hypothetical protein
VHVEVEQWSGLAARLVHDKVIECVVLQDLFRQNALKKQWQSYVRNDQVLLQEEKVSGECLSPCELIH